VVAWVLVLAELGWLLLGKRELVARKVVVVVVARPKEVRV
jgi:hypothetical protein